MLSHLYLYPGWSSWCWALKTITQEQTELKGTVCLTAIDSFIWNEMLTFLLGYFSRFCLPNSFCFVDERTLVLL